MRSRGLERLLRFLLILLGIGVGLAATQLGLQWFQLANPNVRIPAWVPFAGYAGAGTLGGLILLLLSGRILRRFTFFSSEMQKQLSKMPVNQLMSSITGLILGLIVAALLRQMFSFLGNSIAATALNAILYVTLGALGYNIGKRRSREFLTMITRLSGVREKRKITRHGYASRKFVDTSALIDGRVLEILKTGFIEGEVVLPEYVAAELQAVADSPDEATRERGRRGLSILNELKEQNLLTVEPSEDLSADDVDVKLLRAARDVGGTVITTDYNLQKAATITGIRTLNVNALAEAVRPAVTAGMEMTVRVTREGREPGQGIAHLPDGTMIVIEGGKERVGGEAAIIIASVRQTSAGRMIFARLK